MTFSSDHTPLPQASDLRHFLSDLYLDLFHLHHEQPSMMMKTENQVVEINHNPYYQTISTSTKNKPMPSDLTPFPKTSDFSS